MSTIVDPADKYKALYVEAKALDTAQRKSIECATRRHDLPMGSSRARVTTANANHANAAEFRDKRIEAFERELDALGYARKQPTIDRDAIAIEVLATLGYVVRHSTSTNPAVSNFDVNVNGQKIDHDRALLIFVQITGRSHIGHTLSVWTFSV